MTSPAKTRIQEVAMWVSFYSVIAGLRKKYLITTSRETSLWQHVYVAIQLPSLGFSQLALDQMIQQKKYFLSAEKDFLIIKNKTNLLFHSFSSELFKSYQLKHLTRSNYN